MAQDRPLVAGCRLSRDGAHESAARVPMRRAGEAPGFPEIGVPGPVRCVEQRGEFMEVAVLGPVEALVGLGRGARERGGTQCRGRVGGRQVRAAHGEVHAGREQRIDETGGIAYEDEAWRRHRRRAPRPVAHDVGTVAQQGVPEHRVRQGRRRDLVAEEALAAGLADPPRPEVPVHDGPDARDASGQGDLPQPPVLVRLDEDIAVIGRVEVTATLEVTVDGQVAEERVPFLQAARAGHEGALTGGVDHHAGVHAVSVREFDAAFMHCPDRLALVHAHAARRAVLEQDLVEAGPPHLVGVGEAPVRLREVPAPRRPVPAPGHRGAGLAHETLRLDGRQHADVFEHRERGGEQRFAHVGARELLALVQGNVEPGAREQGGGGAAGRSAAGDDYVCAGRAELGDRVNPRPPVRRRAPPARRPRPVHWSAGPPRTDP